MRLWLILGVILGTVLSPVYGEVLDQRALAEKGVLLADIGDDQLLCVINGNHEDPGARWFLLGGHWRNRELASAATAFVHVVSIDPSPDKRLLAVISAAEGATMLEIFDLARYRRTGEWVLLHDCNPFPGQISINTWRKRLLEVTSDFPLYLNRPKLLNRHLLLLGQNETFLIDPENGMVMGGASKREKFLREVLADLRSAQVERRSEAVKKIGALNEPELTQALAKAVKRERSKSLRQFMRDTLFDLSQVQPQQHD